MQHSSVVALSSSEPSILGQRLFEDIFESPANGLLLLDNSFHILRAGKGICDLLGYQPHELFGKYIRKLVSQDDWPLVQASLDQIASTKFEPFSVERHYLHKNGTPLWVLVNVAALASCEGHAMPAIVLQVTSIDKQKQAERHAEEVGQRWSSALESAGQGVWDCDVPTDTWTYSSNWKRIRGIPEDEAVIDDDESWLAQIHPDDRQVALEHMQKRQSISLENISYEYRQMHRDGHWIWILARGRCIEFLPDGSPKRIIGTDTDITALKKAEYDLQRMAQMEMRWKTAIESANEGLWDHDLASGQKFYSNTWMTMRGLELTDNCQDYNDSWLERIHPDDKDMVLETIHQQNLGENDTVSMEYREKHKDGHWISILSRGQITARDEKGNALRSIGTDTDVTEIRNRELQVSEVSHRLELALSTSQVGVWQFNLKTYETHWDKRACEIFGIAPTEHAIATDEWESLLHPEDCLNAIETCNAAIAKRVDFSHDYRIIRNDGSMRYLRTRGSFPSQGTDREMMIGVVLDVTQDVEKAEAFRSAKMLAENRFKDLEIARNHLEHVSLHDALTGLPNRRHLDKLLMKFHVGSKQGESLTLLHIDLDRFKQINDTKGHAAGDAVLVQTAMLLRTQFRNSDLVARIGGDEFVVLLSPSPDRRILQSMIDRVIQISIQPITWQGQECRCGVSVGVAESTGDIDPKQLLINADIALYRAKGSGRNCAVHFTGSLQAEVIANKQCADDMMNGLEREEFIPYYQPIFNAKTRDVAGVEALVRWQHPTRGVLAPDKFLAVASELNAMNAIDRTILEQALAHLKHWDEIGLSIPKISVNVSARRLDNESLLESLSQLNIQPGRVSFELLESIFLDDGDDVNTRNIDEIKKMGIGIDVDDFGTGHASIVSLLRLNPNRMKIDRQLTRNIVESESQRKLVKSLIEIGKSQNIAVCAEGVETAEHAKILTQMDCDYLQGYYFAKPMTFAEVEPFILRGHWCKHSGLTGKASANGKMLKGFMKKIGLAKAS